MDIKKFGNKIIVRIDPGEEILETLLHVCKEHDVRLGSIMGIGATNKASIGLFDIASKMYHKKEFVGTYEITSLCGNVTRMNDEPYLHIHITLCDDRHRSFGGHLNTAIVSATCECIIDSIEGVIERFTDKETGLNLVKL